MTLSQKIRPKNLMADAPSSLLPAVWHCGDSTNDSHQSAAAPRAEAQGAAPAVLRSGRGHVPGRAGDRIPGAFGDRRLDRAPGVPQRLPEARDRGSDGEIAEIKRLKEQIEALLSRKQVIESLQTFRTEGVHLMNEMARQMPKASPQVGEGNRRQGPVRRLCPIQRKGVDVDAQSRRLASPQRSRSWSRPRRRSSMAGA